jgi:hypothetical protein
MAETRLRCGPTVSSMAADPSLTRPGIRHEGHHDFREQELIGDEFRRTQS